MSANIVHATRLVAAALGIAVALAVLCAQAAGDEEPAHRCIHDDVQQRVLDAVAQQRNGPLAVSASGLPLVSLVSSTHEGAADLAAANTMPTSPLHNRGWGPLRILLSTDDLNDPTRYCHQVGQQVGDHRGGLATCTAEDILTPNKKAVLLSYLTSAVQMHTERLSVDQIMGTWKVGVMPPVVCSSFIVPPTHHNPGIAGYDFVLYVGSAPTPPGVGAWATICMNFGGGRPAVGVMVVSAATITTPHDTMKRRILLHELTHALGFNAVYFTQKGFLKKVPGGRGRPGLIPVLTGPMTTQMARQHFGCSSLSNMELEDQGGAGSAESHFKMRNAKDELMGPMTSIAYYTNLTLAVLEDLGFYRVDYREAESMGWGQNAGCDFFTEKCMVDNVTKWPQMFCNESGPEVRCPTDRLGLGACSITTHPAPLPPQYQYFLNLPKVGGRVNFMDFCPFVNAFGNTPCNVDPSKAPQPYPLFNLFGDSSRCIDANFRVRTTMVLPVLKGLCVAVTCNRHTKTYQIQLPGSTTPLLCHPGRLMHFPTSSRIFKPGGTFTCPPYLEVCQANTATTTSSDAAEDTGNSAGDTAAPQL